MKPILLLMAACLCAAPSQAGMIHLSGTVLDLDSTAKSGVVVALAGTSLSATTDVGGAWAFSGVSGVLPKAAKAKAASKHLLVVDGRIRLSFDGRDPSGRSLSDIVPSALSAVGASARTEVDGSIDTLVYSWNGKVFLRDTVGDLDRSTPFRRVFDTTADPAIAYGYVTDAQGHVYRTTTIGAQTWMAQNLDVKVDSSYCYDDSASNCALHGRLYQWAAAMGLDTTYDEDLWNGTLPHQGLCPGGWHVPDTAEWNKLTDTVLDGTEQGRILRSVAGWGTDGDASHNGSDSVGLGVSPTGYRGSWGSYGGIEGYAYLWTASQGEASFGLYRAFSSGDIGITADYNKKIHAFGVRCIRD